MPKNVPDKIKSLNMFLAYFFFRKPKRERLGLLQYDNLPFAA